jgi:hypothetical protein
MSCDQRLTRMGGGRTIVWIRLLLLLCLSLFLLGASGNPKADGSTFIIRTKDNCLTAKLKDISLEKVFAEIADQTGIQIVFYGPTEGTLSADFSDLPVDIGLRRLTRGFDHVFIYRRGEKRGPGAEIEKVIIYAKSDERPKKGLGPGGIAHKKSLSRSSTTLFWTHWSKPWKTRTRKSGRKRWICWRN